MCSAGARESGYSKLRRGNARNDQATFGLDCPLAEKGSDSICTVYLSEDCKIAIYFVAQYATLRHIRMFEFQRVFISSGLVLMVRGLDICKYVNRAPISPLPVLSVQYIALVGLLA